MSLEEYWSAVLRKITCLVLELVLNIAGYRQHRHSLRTEYQDRSGRVSVLSTKRLNSGGWGVRYRQAALIICSTNIPFLIVYKTGRHMAVE